MKISTRYSLPDAVAILTTAVVMPIKQPSLMLPEESAKCMPRGALTLPSLTNLFACNLWRACVYVQELTEQLASSGVKCVPLHGRMQQRNRNLALSDFRSGKARCLVATEVASRGLDIKKLS